MNIIVSLASDANRTRDAMLLQDPSRLMVKQLRVRRGIPPEENEKLRMGDESKIDLYSPISILLTHPTTGRAGWGADFNPLAQRNNTESTAIRKLEFETSFSCLYCSARLKIDQKDGYPSILRRGIITFDACYSRGQLQGVVALLGYHTRNLELLSSRVMIAAGNAALVVSSNFG